MCIVIHIDILKLLVTSFFRFFLWEAIEDREFIGSSNITNSDVRDKGRL
jgi:hypothetical protein